MYRYHIYPIIFNKLNDGVNDMNNQNKIKSNIFHANESCQNLLKLPKFENGEEPLFARASTVTIGLSPTEYEYERSNFKITFYIYGDESIMNSDAEIEAKFIIDDIDTIEELIETAEIFYNDYKKIPYGVNGAKRVINDLKHSDSTVIFIDEVED